MPFPSCAEIEILRLLIWAVFKPIFHWEVTLLGLIIQLRKSDNCGLSETRKYH